MTLAGTPDDASIVPDLLRSIIRCAADELPPISYASVTRYADDSYVTVAMTSEVALAVDEAQYAADSGPCLDALQTAEPISMPRIDATLKWPRFRVAAHQLGLRASVSIPVFAGRGVSIAALNLYGTDTDSMAPLTAAVLAAFENLDGEGAAVPVDGHDAGIPQLVTGLSGAFRVRAEIQRAIGVLMSHQRIDADDAYAILRSRAAVTSQSLTAAARSVLSATGEEQRPG